MQKYALNLHLREAKFSVYDFKYTCTYIHTIYRHHSESSTVYLFQMLSLKIIAIEIYVTMKVGNPLNADIRHYVTDFINRFSVCPKNVGYISNDIMESVEINR